MIQCVASSRTDGAAVADSGGTADSISLLLLFDDDDMIDNDVNIGLYCSLVLIDDVNVCKFYGIDSKLNESGTGEVEQCLCGTSS